MPSTKTIRQVTVQYRSEGEAAFVNAAKAVAEAHREAGGAATQAAEQEDRAARRRLGVAGSWDRLLRAVNENYKAQQLFDRGVRTANAALQQGIASVEEHADALALLRARFDAVGEAAAKAAQKQKEAAQRLVDRQTVRPDRGADIAAAFAEADRVRAGYDKVYAAQEQYRNGLARLRQELRVGMIDQRLYDEELARQKGAFADRIRGLGRMSRPERDAVVAEAARSDAEAENAARDRAMAAAIAEGNRVLSERADAFQRNAREARDLASAIDVMAAEEERHAAAMARIRELEAGQHFTRPGQADAALAQERDRAERNRLRILAEQTSIETGAGNDRLAARADEYQRQLREQAEAERRATAEGNRRLAERADAYERENQRLQRFSTERFQQADPEAYEAERHKRALADIEEAQRRGILTGERYNAVLKAEHNLHQGIGNDLSGFRNARASRITNLGYQANDIVGGLMSGQSMSMIAAQQGPQIYQILGDHPQGFRAGAKELGSTLAGLPARIGPVGLAIGGLAAAFGGAMLAVDRYQTSQRNLEASLNGIGRMSGVAAGQLSEMAEASARAGRMSNVSAREVAGTLAATGRIAPDLYRPLIEQAKNYAAITGTDVTEATKELAAAFADPARGAAQLTERLGSLNDSQRELVERLARSGDRMGAQRALLNGITPQLASAADRTSLWAKAWDTVARSASNAADAVGRALTGPQGEDSVNERLQTAEALANARALNARRFTSRRMRETYTDPDAMAGVNRDIEYEQENLRRRQQAQMAATATLRQAEASRMVGDIVHALNPAQEQLKRIEDQARAVQDRLKVIPFDERKDAERALEGLQRQARQLREDLVSGGAQFADQLRQAQFNRSMVGVAPSARGVAEVNERVEQQIRDITRQNQDPAVMAEQARAIREAGRLEIERIRAETVRTEGTYARSLRDVPEQYRDTIQRAAETRGIDPSLLASVAYEESRFNPRATGRVTRTGERAQGMFQFMPGTAAQYGIDPYNVEQAADAAALYLRRSLDRRNGNVAQALADYNWGPGYVSRVGGDVARFPDETRRYINNITRQQPGTQEQVGQLEGFRREVTAAGEQAQIAGRYYGQNGEALERQQRVQQMLTDAQARNQPVTEALRAEYERTAAAMVAASRNLAATRLGRDLVFEREQLGRTQQDQAAYSRARGQFGDTTSPAAQAAIETMRLNDNLRETKDLASGAFSGMLTDLSRGTDLAKSFTSQLTRMSDRLIQLGSDRIISGLFGGGAGGGSGWLGSLVGLGGTGGGGNATAVPNLYSSPAGPGFAAGGYTGAGGRYEPAGIVHRGEFVINAESTRQHMSLLQAINDNGLPGYARGGYVAPVMPVPSGGPRLNVNVNNSAGADIGVGELRSDGSGGFNLDIAVDAIEGRIAQKAAGGRGPLKQAVNSAATRRG